MHVPKLLKEELGGGKKEFSLSEGGIKSLPFMKQYLKLFNSRPFHLFH